MEVIYGGGDKGSVVSKGQIGELEALVVPDLSDNLVSFADFTDKGSTILLDSAGGVISNSLNDKRIVLKKDVGTWRLSLSDIANYDHKQDPYTVYSASISKDSTSDVPPTVVCYRCGRPGHLKYNFNTRTACPSTVCSVCKAHIGTDNHNSRNCSKESARVFPNAARSSKKKPAGKGRKPAATRSNCLRT